MNTCRCGQRTARAPCPNCGLASDDEVQLLRAKNAELNRRCQTLEAGIAEKVGATPSGQSLGRALANAAATTNRAELARLRVELEETMALLGRGVELVDQSRVETYQELDAKFRRLLRALRVFWRGYRDNPNETAGLAAEIGLDRHVFRMTPQAVALAKAALDEFAEEPDAAV